MEWVACISLFQEMTAWKIAYLTVADEKMDTSDLSGDCTSGTNDIESCGGDNEPCESEIKDQDETLLQGICLWMPAFGVLCTDLPTSFGRNHQF